MILFQHMLVMMLNVFCVFTTIKVMFYYRRSLLNTLLFLSVVFKNFVSLLICQFLMFQFILLVLLIQTLNLIIFLNFVKFHHTYILKRLMIMMFLQKVNMFILEFNILS